MGSHHKGPSLINNSQPTMNLLQLLQSDPSLVGNKVAERFGTDSLPYLFKVLSVKKALSIQAHPNKKCAEYLHKTRPDIYQDDNHKPEIAIGNYPFFNTNNKCTFLALDSPNKTAMKLKNIISFF